MSNKFNNGKIYKIIDNTNGNIYIGSTILTLKNRLSMHKSKFKRFTNGRTKNYYSSFEILKNNNFDIILIENFPCSNLEELLIREKKIINEIPCININKGNFDKKEYYTANKDKLKDYDKVYYQNNKDKIYNQQKQYRLTNKEKIKESNKKYYKKNKIQKELTLNINIPSNTKLTINLNIDDEEYEKLEGEFEELIK